MTYNVPDNMLGTPDDKAKRKYSQFTIENVS